MSNLERTNEGSRAEVSFFVGATSGRDHPASLAPHGDRQSAVLESLTGNTRQDNLSLMSCTVSADVLVYCSFHLQPFQQRRVRRQGFG